ncbi:MAG: TRAP transporter substrate-binding protein DctP [Treponema sp.]|nr:TRAP transporter substrate-binding protein DctP [Treponema sp.]
MKMLKKITAVVLAASLAGIASAKTIIKVASVAPARSSWDVDQRTISADWARITGGEVELQFMNSDSMGGEGGVVKKLNSVRPGQKPPIGGAVFTSLGIDSFCPESHIMTLCVPLMFRNQEEVNAVLDKFTPEMQKPLEAKGYTVLGFFNIGWCCFFTKNPVHTPDDLKKQRLTVGGNTSPMLANAFKSAGYLTMDVPADKLLQSMKTPGGVEGVFTIPMYGYAAQYYKTLTNILNVPLCPVMVTFIISKAEWDAIPEKFKPELLASIRRAEKKFIEAQQKNDSEYLKRCESGGAVVFTPNAAQLKLWNDEFADKARYMYDPKSPVADKDFYERITAFLNKFRGN